MPETEKKKSHMHSKIWITFKILINFHQVEINIMSFLLISY